MALNGEVDDVSSLNKEDLKELRAVFRNKSVQKWLATLEARAEQANKLLVLDLVSEQGRMLAIKQQGYVEGLLSVIQDAATITGE